MEFLDFVPADQGRTVHRSPLTGEQAELAAPWREKLVDALAERDDGLLERYLSGEELDAADLRAGVRALTLERAAVPVFCGSALRNIGVQPVMDAINAFLPDPEETAPVVGVTLEGREKRALVASPSAPLAALAFKVTMDSGRKLVLMRLYSGTLNAGDTVYNATQGESERVARLFHLHAGTKEKTDTALAGEIVAAAGMKLARTGDTLCANPKGPDTVLLESIEAYKPVISLALEPQNTEEGDRLDEVFAKFLLEDPTLFAEQDKETGQRLISGMGELHLEVVLERLRREYKLDPRVGKPQVVYQETISKPAEGVGEFDRELGEVPHYGYVAVAVEPRARDKGLDVSMEVDPDQWPEAWLTAVEQGVRDSLQSGVIKGYPVQDLRVLVKELRRREGQSTPAGYHMAAVAAVKDALAKAGPLLLEPIMFVEISVPGEFVGDAISLLGSKGAKVENMFDHAGQKVVQALASMRQLFGFSTDLRSATQGRAGLLIKFARFDVLG
jgi:elongation factor G